jgi:hypothetical protein
MSIESLIERLPAERRLSQAMIAWAASRLIRREGALRGKVDLLDDHIAGRIRGG